MPASRESLLDMDLDSIIESGLYGKAKVSDRGGSERSMPYGRKGSGKGGGAGGCRVFVGNLPFSVRWQELKDHMREAGVVIYCDIIEDPGAANNSKGCGLVEYSSPREARAAVIELTNSEIRGRPIFVREDREPGLSIHAAARGGGGSYRETRDTPAVEAEGGLGGDPSCCVYVGNLAYSVTWQLLKDHMRAAGDVVRCDVLPEPGTTMGSKGCGVVEFATPGGARRAIRQLTDTMLNGRAIYVREDRLREDCHMDDDGDRGDRRKGSGKGFGAKSSGGRGDDFADCRVFVGNLPYRVTWRELKDHMRKAGEVVHCDILEEPGTTMGSKGCGIVEYATARDARRAILRLNDTFLDGRPIFVREDRE